MEFKRAVKKQSLNQHTVEEKYPTDLQLYIDAPTDVVDIEEFQQLAVERVKLLRILELITVRNNRDTPIKDQVAEEMLKQGVKYFLPLIKGYADQETRKRDYLSHYILRLSYCRSEEYRRWFLARELEFFKLKFFNLEKREDLIKFMTNTNLNYTPISNEEKTNLSNELMNSTSKNIVFESCSFYKVPFTKVNDLVRARRVLVKEGFAYVPNQDLISILSSIFRAKLSHSLSICAANLSTLEGDERLARILKGLHTSYTGNDYGVKKDKNHVPPAAIDGLSKKSFSPCMRSMYDIFKKTHHLRNTARLQFGLFLKGIGVSLEDSLKFWREGFTQKPEVDGDKFEKSYSYGIRHSYGTEGKRTNYTPHSCMKIITTSVGSGDNHGCPFRHCDSTNLRSKLQGFGLSVKDVSDVAELAGRGHYQLACTRYFEITHNVQNATGINHPNQYFEESQMVITGGKKLDGIKKEEGKSERMSSQTGEWGDESINLDLTSLEAQMAEPMAIE